MTKSRKKKSKPKRVVREGHYKYCPHCGCRKMINGTCHICGVTEDRGD